VNDEAESAATVGQRLRCANCGREADNKAKGWRALHGRGEPQDQPETFVFCPVCAEQEFGDHS
jgi:hypothetical protein